MEADVTDAAESVSKTTAKLAARNGNVPRTAARFNFFYETNVTYAPAGRLAERTVRLSTGE